MRYKFEYIQKANLPEKDVRVVAMSSKYPHLKQAFEKIGILTIDIPYCKDITSPVSCHADMIMHHLGGNKLALYDYNDDFNFQLKLFGFDITLIKEKLNKDYPFDIALNSFGFDGTLVCNEKYTSKTLLNSDTYSRVVNVKQGYAKCSTLMLNEKSFVTTDIMIKKKLVELGKEVLFLDTESIVLDGYDCGFIGGCAGKIGKNKIAFTGDIHKHEFADELLDFLEKQNIEPIMLNGEKLIDVGSIIPLIY